MTIVFQNRGLMPLDAVRLMGVSVKPSSGAPIGFFGTGLKYAIAVLLREGCRVELWLGRQQYTFSTYDIDFRGEKLQQVQMTKHWDGGSSNHDLPFTTQYGRTWEAWQAYREIYCNMRDEPEGRCFRVDSEEPHGMSFLNSLGDDPARDDLTTILVEGPAIEEAHRNRHTTILQTDPLVVLAGVEVHAGPSDHIFYQGIRVHKLDRPSLFTYNLTSRQQLTEDRTLAWSYGIAATIGRALVKCVRPEIITVVLSAREQSLEGSLPYTEIKDELPSEQFMQVAQQMRADQQLEGAGRNLFVAYADHGGRYGFNDPRIVEPTMVQQAIHDRAREIVFDRFPEFLSLHVVYRSQTGADTITAHDGVLRLSAELLNATPERLAEAMLEGLAVAQGGSPAEQLARRILHGEWIPREQVRARSAGEEFPF